MIPLAGSFLLFTLKIIRMKSVSWLISSGLCLAFVFLAFVSTFSIDKYIARKNIDRYLIDSRLVLLVLAKRTGPIGGMSIVVVVIEQFYNLYLSIVQSNMSFKAI